MDDRLREIIMTQQREEKEKTIWKDKFVDQSFTNMTEQQELQATLQQRKNEHKKNKDALLAEFDYAHQAWKK
jgi:hypothetical protein